MFSKIELNAFKSFPEDEIPLKPLTLLAGLNNSGKSSVIQALRMHCTTNKDPFLEGYGSIDELRSNLSPPNTPVSVTCEHVSGVQSTLEISNEKISIPKSEVIPVTIHVGANRLGPKAYLPMFRSVNSFLTVGSQGEFVLDFLNKLRNEIVDNRLHHHASEGVTLEFETRGWLSEIAPEMQFIFETEPKRDTAYAEFNNFRPANVGFGISYTLPIIAGLLGITTHNERKDNWGDKWLDDWQKAKLSHGALIMLENPEAHLHPKGQTSVGRLLAIVAACGVQVIVETHSDHLMDGIRIAVKDGLLDSKSAIFHYFSKKRIEDPSTFETPILTKDGKLSFWPEGFFDQTMKNRAQLARRK